MNWFHPVIDETDYNIIKKFKNNKMKKLNLILSMLFIALLISCQTETKKETADMVFTNGNVITVDEAQPQQKLWLLKTIK